MASTPATKVLDELGIAYTVHEFTHDDARSKELGGFGKETAAVLGIEEERLFKTLIAAIGKELVCGVVPVDGHMDLKALAKALGAKKADMAEHAAAERSSGYVAGGISPLGQRTKLRTVIDETVELFDTVLVSGGKRGFQVELAPADLIPATGAVVAPIATD